MRSTSAELSWTAGTMVEQADAGWRGEAIRHGLSAQPCLYLLYANVLAQLSDSLQMEWRLDKVGIAKP